MPQTELLIHIVIDTEVVSPAAQTEIHSASLGAAVESLGEAVTIHRSGIEVRPLPEAAAAPQASAPAPVGAAPAPAPAPTPTRPAVPGPHNPPEGAGAHEVA